MANGDNAIDWRYCAVVVVTFLSLGAGVLTYFIRQDTRPTPSAEELLYREAAGYLCGTARTRGLAPSPRTQTELVTEIADQYGGLSRPRILVVAAEMCPQHVIP